MIAGMTAETSTSRSAKITVSLPADLHARAKADVERRGTESFSAYVAEALEAHLNERDFDELLDEALDASGGPITRDEQAWLDDFFGRTDG